MLLLKDHLSKLSSILASIISGDGSIRLLVHLPWNWIEESVTICLLISKLTASVENDVCTCYPVV